MALRLASLTLAALLAVAACAGPPAPAVTGSGRVCGDPACAAFPAGWVAETGPGFVAFTNPQGARASVGTIDMRGVVEGAGGSWPAAPETVVRAFWSLVDGGRAELEELVVAGDGSVRSRGRFQTGVLWHRLLPGSGEAAVGVEVRAPDRGWQPHADVLLDGVEPL